MANKTLTTKKTSSNSKKKTKKAISIVKESKPKLTLAEKQEINLLRQKEREAAKTGQEPANKSRFYCTNKELLAELEKWRDSSDKVENRIISEELGKMFLAIANKLLNHSSFRNYSKELKEDLRGYGLYKLIRGMKNYNFKFNNPFAWATLALWNAYVAVIVKHYKQLNIKRDLMTKLAQELQTYTGMNAASSLNKCIKSYLGNDAEVE